MRVTVTVVGEATHDVSAAVEATHVDRVRVLRSIKGGSAGAPLGGLP
jgi:hypothetical protein